MMILSSSETGAQNYKMENAKVQNRVILMQKYLDHQADRELQALYALPALVHKLDHPAGMELVSFILILTVFSDT